MISYRPRSALRDVGKALGLDPLDRSNGSPASMQWWDGSNIDDESRAAKRASIPTSPVLARVLALARAAARFPAASLAARRRLRDRRDRLDELVPIENAAMADRTVIQWDKDDLDALGLLKVDVLGLGMLTAHPPQLRAGRAAVAAGRCDAGDACRPKTPRSTR